MIIEKNIKVNITSDDVLNYINSLTENGLAQLTDRMDDQTLMRITTQFLGKLHDTAPETLEKYMSGFNAKFIPNDESERKEFDYKKLKNGTVFTLQDQIFAFTIVAQTETTYTYEAMVPLFFGLWKRGFIEKCKFESLVKEGKIIVKE